VEIIAGPEPDLLAGLAAKVFPERGRVMPSEAASEESRNFLLLYIMEKQ
jgi:hypothetical protein